MRTILPVLLALLPSFAFADVWVANRQAVSKLDPAMGSVAFSLSVANTKALAVDPRNGNVWILNDAKLASYRPAGTLRIEVDLKAIAMEGAVAIALDARDGSIWLGEGGGSATAQNKSITQIDSEGAVKRTLPSPGGLSGIAVALDQSVWVLGKKQLHHYTAAGTFLAEIDLAPMTEGEPKLLSVDSISAWILVGGEKRVVRVDAQRPPTTSPALTALPSSVDQLAVDEAHGVFYALAGNTVYRIPSGAGTGSSIALGTLGISGASALAFDPASQRVFVGHSSGVSRFSRDLGGHVAIPTSGGADLVGASPLALETSVTITAPVAGALLNSDRPTFELRLNPLCSGNACGFAPSVLQTYTIAARLSGSDVGSRFAFDGTLGTFRFTPTAPLPQGPNSLAVSATDPFGRASPEESVSFAIDSIAPTFLNLSPASGASVNTAAVRVSGTVSEPASVQVGGASQDTGSGNTFAIDVPLSEGSNALTIGARDAAGNSSSQAITVVRDTTPPVLSDITPANGSVIGGSSTTIAGRVSEPSTITVTYAGGTATADGTTFSFPVALANGTNSFELLARDRAGNETRLTHRLERSSPITLTVASPANGQAVDGAIVVVAGTVAGPGPMGVSVNGVLAPIVNGAFAAAVPLQPGLNPIKVVATAQDGATAMHEISVSSIASSRAQLRYDPAIGVAPFKTSIYVPSGVSVQADFDGNGTFDASHSGGGFLSYRFDSPGLYRSKLQVADASGTYALELPIAVQDVRVLDVALQELIQRMRGRLAAQDIEGALAFFTPSAQPRYRDILTQLRDALPAISRDFGTIDEGLFMQGLAEYILVAHTPTGKQAFYIHLVLGPDGIWRISSL